MDNYMVTMADRATNLDEGESSAAIGFLPFSAL
jgi:hypothetical protein